MDLLHSGTTLLVYKNYQINSAYLCHTCWLPGWVYCHQTHGLREVEQHHCLVLPMPLMGSHHTVDVSVGPIHKILKNGNCVGMLQYLFIESSKRKKSLTHAIQKKMVCALFTFRCT